jgi:hypothetical protein
MSQGEVLAIIDTSRGGNIDSCYFNGKTRDGRTFSGCCGFEGLPANEEIAHAELEVCDEQGRELVISLGRNGVASSIWLRSDYPKEFFEYNVSRMFMR